MLTMSSERRRRCEIRAPGAPCIYCYDRRLSCTSSEPSKMLELNDSARFLNYQPSFDIPTPIDISRKGKAHLPDQSLCTELVQLYFDYVHDQFHTLFHKPSFMENLLQGQAPSILVNGMMALSARWVLHSTTSQANDAHWFSRTQVLQ